MPRQIETRPFGLQAVPAGRQAEAVESIPPALVPRVASREGSQVGDGARYFAWPNRDALARQIRRDESNAPSSRWRPLQALADGEGY